MVRRQGQKLPENESPDPDPVPAGWLRTSRSRLRFELAGLAFACQHGFTPEDYARHLWSHGAVAWMGKQNPDAAEYLRKEVGAFLEFYPEVAISLIRVHPGIAELVFTRGCLGGWGDAPWSLARSLGLNKKCICAYCQESFRLWTRQLGLASHIGPSTDGHCHLLVVKNGDSPALSGADRNTNKRRYGLCT